MRKGGIELMNTRREEIINACEELYKTMSFKEITIKEIGNVTSFTRTSIYNYFETKEEIFLALLKRENDLWASDLNRMIDENSKMSVDDFASALAHSLEDREQLLKILSMNHYDMEENSRKENLTEFKISYGNTLKAVKRGLDKFFADMSEADKQGFIYAFFPFTFGIYPYAVVTEKQKTAMADAGVDYKYMSIYDMIYSCVKRLLKTA